MAKCYFNQNGMFDIWEDEPGTPELPDSLTEVPDDTALWRLSYDHDTSTLTVKYSGMTDAEAEAAADVDIQTAHDAFVASLEA